MSGAEPRGASERDEAGMTAVWHRVMDAWNDRDFGRMTSLLTEDAVLRTDPDWPGGGLVARDEVFLSHEDALSRARDAS